MYPKVSLMYLWVVYQRFKTTKKTTHAKIELWNQIIIWIWTDSLCITQKTMEESEVWRVEFRSFYPERTFCDFGEDIVEFRGENCAFCVFKTHNLKFSGRGGGTSLPRGEMSASRANLWYQQWIRHKYTHFI